MSRTYKDRKRQYRILKNSLYKKELNMWSEDIVHKTKDRMISRRLRKVLKRKCYNEIQNSN